MFGAAPIERSTLTSSQKSKTSLPSPSVTTARSEKELTQLLMSGSSMEHLALTRSGSAGQLGTSSTATVSSSGVSAVATSVTRSMRQPLESTQRGTRNKYTLFSGHFTGELAGSILVPFSSCSERGPPEIIDPGIFTGHPPNFVKARKGTFRNRELFIFIVKYYVFSKTNCS